jgi:oxygen-independent coproporphyrinogen-3 oxidase
METIAVQLRRAEGIVRSDFSNQTGFALEDLVGVKLRELVAQELVADEGMSIRLTRRGKCVADGIIETLMRHACV